MTRLLECIQSPNQRLVARLSQMEPGDAHKVLPTSQEASGQTVISRAVCNGSSTRPTVLDLTIIVAPVSQRLTEMCREGPHLSNINSHTAFLTDCLPDSKLLTIKHVDLVPSRSSSDLQASPCLLKGLSSPHLKASLEKHSGSAMF